MVALSTLTVDSPLWLLGCFVALLGLGLGTSMQLLVLVVQNSFPIEEVGTATASNNYFRQIGATLGVGVVGSVFTTRVATLITERIPDAADAGIHADSLTPGIVRALPDSLHLAVIESYNEALTPIYLAIAPLALIAAVCLFFVIEKPLATTIERKTTVADA